MSRLQIEDEVHARVAVVADLFGGSRELRRESWVPLVPGDPSRGEEYVVALRLTALVDPFRHTTESVLPALEAAGWRVRDVDPTMARVHHADGGVVVITFGETAVALVAGSGAR